MALALWTLACVALALLVWVLFLLTRRNPLQSELDDARTLLAVGRERIASHEATQGTLAQELTGLRDRAQALVGDNSRLSTRLENVEQQLREFEQLRRMLAEAEQQRLVLTTDKQGLATERDGLRERLKEQRAWIEEQTTQFGQKVLATAAQLMEDRGKAFTETNISEVNAVVAPFKEQLDKFRQRVDHIYDTENNARGELKQQIVQLTTLNQEVSREAHRLTNALTITSKSTGDWGETILRKILEDSGLREGREYKLQYSVTSQEGERQQPDAVLFLPGNRQLVVDSKVSNKSWTQYCGETDEEMRQLRLKDHLVSLRAHVRGLASRDYARSPDLSTVDFVLMFVPVEGALLTAFSADDALYSDAFRSKIILVTPSTLMAVVKLAEGLWTLQTRKESADEIAEAGRKLYEKLTTFAETFVEIGDAIGKAGAQFDKAKGQLTMGRGNAIGLAQKMVQLGVSPSAGKVMPVELLGGGEDDGA
ncbi:MAG: DNA recombination protein RmuC [Pseudomonadota bacterium]